MVVIAAVVATLAGGIALDARGPEWGQPVVVLWTWSVLAWIFTASDSAHRRELAICLVLATCGELFLMEVWGLYTYRLGNLPLFIPPGHALVFAAAVRMSRRAPRWLPTTVALPVGVYLAIAAWTGIDTQGVLWFVLFIGYLHWTHDQELCAVLFLFALLIEAYGTALGGWRYHPVEPWFGLTTTNPPICVGAIYCTLETLVRLAARGETLAAFDGRCILSTPPRKLRAEGTPARRRRCSSFKYACIFSVVAPCRRGGAPGAAAALGCRGASPVSVRRQTFTTDCCQHDFSTLSGRPRPLRSRDTGDTRAASKSLNQFECIDHN